MPEFTLAREGLSSFPALVVGELSKGFAMAQSSTDMDVDEMMETAQQQAADAATAVPPELVNEAGSNMGVWIVVIAIVIIVGFMLYLIGRNLRSGRDEAVEPQENPLFDDEFVVQDEEIEILAEGENLASELVHDDSDTDNIGLEDEPMMTTETNDAEIAEQIETPTVEDNDAQKAPLTFAEVVAEDDRPEGDASVLAPILELSEAEDHSEHTIDHDEENVIHLKDRTEYEHKDDSSADDLNEDLSEAAIAETDFVAADEAASDDPAEDPASPPDEEQNVRYAFASATAAPLAFSGISDEEEDVQPSRARPYIAPTVLREDLEKIEREQATRIDSLRNELSMQIGSMKAEHNNRLDLIINAIDRKMESLAELTKQGQKESVQPFANLSPEVNTKMGALQSTLDNQGQRIRAITQILDDRLDTVSHVYGEVRSVGDKIDSLNSRLDELEKSMVERAQQDVLSDVQLSDVIRSCLSPDSYEFKALLGNNNRADCLIRLPHPPGAIVIDTKFPLDAFNALPPREEVARNVPQAKAAEDSFRRSVLRHIIDVAERYIIPGETADSALLFLPTEAIYTMLHSRFPDLVRDSFRARVWIVSPSTLMGTLQTLRGVLRDNKEKENAESVKREAQEVMTEVESLRSQASMLAQNFEKTQTELRSLLDATNKVVSRSHVPPTPVATHSALMDHLYDNKPEWPGRSADHTRDTERADPRPPSLYDDKNARPDNLR